MTSPILDILKCEETFALKSR